MRRPGLFHLALPGLLSVLSVLSAGALRAHDFWIEPSSFTPAAGERISVRLRVGQRFVGDPVPRDPQLIERFTAVGSGGETDVLGVPWRDPAGYVSFAEPGLYLIAYDSDRSPLEQDGPKFEHYLAEEGLERISRLRAARGQTAAAGREVFSRCAKSLIAVSGKGGAGFDRVVGLPLELVPEADPTALPAGGELPLRLLRTGKPLAGALVVAIPREAPDARVSGRTGADGRVRLRIDRPGDWLVKAVDMQPAPADSGADWESFWASFTFRR